MFSKALSRCYEISYWPLGNIELLTELKVAPTDQEYLEELSKLLNLPYYSIIP